MNSTKVNAAPPEKALFYRIVIDGERPLQLGIKEVVLLMVATFDCPNTGHWEALLDAETRLRNLIQHGVLPATESGRGYAIRSPRIKVSNSFVPGQFPPWANFSSGEETLYTLLRADVAALSSRLGDGEGLKAWVAPGRTGELTPADRRAQINIGGQRGCRKRILENWDVIEQLYGPNANGLQVLKHLKKDRSLKEPTLKTVQNHICKLRNEKLIP